MADVLLTVLVVSRSRCPAGPLCAGRSAAATAHRARGWKQERAALSHEDAVMVSRTFLTRCLLAALVLPVGATTSRAADAPAATITDDGKQIVLDNGLVS